MARRPTVYDVARRAGVSIATVSFAFSQPERVRPGTLAAVLRAADDLGYTPSASARGLAKGKAGAIGLYSFDHLIQDEVARTTVRSRCTCTRCTTASRWSAGADARPDPVPELPVELILRDSCGCAEPKFS